MNRVLAIRLQPGGALAVLVRGGTPVVVEHARHITLDAADSPQARGEAIAAALSEWRLGKTPVVVAVPRSELSVQTYDLPPAPAEDLADLVHLQAQRDLPIADDGEGFDFLPLAGDEQHPYRVLTAGLLPAQWKALRDACDAAELNVTRIVPEPLGWLEYGRRVAHSHGIDAAALTVFAAVIGRQAVVWAAEGDALRLIRSIWLPEDDNRAADVAALGGELRRTLLALAQTPGGQHGTVKCVYIGSNADEIAGELGATLSKPVQAAPLDQLVRVTSEDRPIPLVELAPAAALAAAAADRRTPPVDLLHPRKRPAPPSRARTYVLAGAAAALLAAALGWKAYRNLQTPLEDAATARAEQQALKPILEKLAVDETKAAAIRHWLDESTSLLAELDQLGPYLRPEPFDSDKFKAEQDLVVTKLTLTNRQMTLDAVAKASDAILPAEGRLRSGNYRVDRGPVETNSKTMPGYAVSVSDTIQHAEAPAPAGGRP
jgi:hypothetical protein